MKIFDCHSRKWNGCDIHVFVLFVCFSPCEHDMNTLYFIVVVDVVCLFVCLFVAVVVLHNIYSKNSKSTHSNCSFAPKFVFKYISFFFSPFQCMRRKFTERGDVSAECWSQSEQSGRRGLDPLALCCPGRQLACRHVPNQQRM